MKNRVDESLEIYGQVKAELGGRVQPIAQRTEAIGDNTVDNMMGELRRAADVEMSQFVLMLLNQNAPNFLYAYAVPQFEGFKKAFGIVLERYQLMDGTEQGDLFAKIEGMFKDIFVEKHAAMGPEAAELVAKKYAVQMIAYLKANAIQAPDLSQNKVGTVY